MGLKTYRIFRLLRPENACPGMWERRFPERRLQTERRACDAGEGLGRVVAPRESPGTRVGRVVVGLPCYLTRTPTCREGNRGSVRSVWCLPDPIIFWATSTHSTDLPTHSLPCAVLSAGELDVWVSLGPELHSQPH